MHEMAMALSMVRLMEQAAEGAHARRVKRARLRLGGLAGLDPRSFESAFASAARGTVAEGCVLEVRRSPEGGEFWIESLDVEVPEEPPPAPPE